MFQGSIIRCSLIAAFVAAIYFSAPFEGMPWWFDGWLGLTVKEFRNARYLVLAMGGLTLVAEVLAAFLPACTIVVRRRARIVAAIVIVAIPVLWMLRVNDWLGDLHHVDRSPFPREMIETAEPLGAATYYFTLWLADQLGLKWSTLLQLVSVVFGAMAVGAMFLWAELVAAEWILLFLMLVTSGVMVLFCGYPEKGTPKAVALVCFYIYAGTRALREPRSAWDHVSSGLLALAALMHGSVLCLLPAHVMFIWWPNRWKRTLLGAGVFFGIIGLLVAAAHHDILTFQRPLEGNTTAPIFWFKKYCITNCGYDFLSFTHFADILNCLLILAPFAVLGVVEAVWHTRGSVDEWLLVGTLGCLFLSCIWFPVFGYRGDWDIFVITPLVMSFFVAQVAVRTMEPHRFRRLAAAWIACTAVHTTTWWLFFYWPL